MLFWIFIETNLNFHPLAMNNWCKIHFSETHPHIYSVINSIQMLNLKSNMQCNKQLRFCLTFLLVYLLHAKLKNHLVQFNIHEFHYIDSFRFFRAQIHASRFFFYPVWLVIIFEMLSTTIITKKKKNCLE